MIDDQTLVKIIKKTVCVYFSKLTFFYWLTGV